MKWQRDLEGVRRQLVDCEWVPEPICEHWKDRCWTCKFASVQTFQTVTCTVTGRLKRPCSECDVP